MKTHFRPRLTWDYEAFPCGIGFRAHLKFTHRWDRVTCQRCRAIQNSDKQRKDRS